MLSGARSSSEQRAHSAVAGCIRYSAVQPRIRAPSYKTTPHAAAAQSKVPDVLTHAVLQEQFDSIDAGIAAVARGEFVLVLDDQNRENEGDLIIAADKVTPSQIAYMVEYTTGAVFQEPGTERTWRFE